MPIIKRYDSYVSIIPSFHNKNISKNKHHLGFCIVLYILDSALK